MEGQTEKAFKRHLQKFLDERCELDKRPRVKLDTLKLDSKLTKPGKVADAAKIALSRKEVIGVVALIDVVCSGSRSFKNAKGAIRFLQRCVPNESSFRAHAAQYDFEAWLLPYWDDIVRNFDKKKRRPGKNPEAVNLDNPPSRRLAELYRINRRKYKKPIEVNAILTGKDLLVSADQCPQFKAFLNSFLFLSGCKEIP